MQLHVNFALEIRPRSAEDQARISLQSRGPVLGFGLKECAGAAVAVCVVCASEKADLSRGQEPKQRGT